MTIRLKASPIGVYAWRALAASALLVAMLMPAHAQQTKAPASNAPKAAEAITTPDTTVSRFGDWTMRCATGPEGEDLRNGSVAANPGAGPERAARQSGRRAGEERRALSVCCPASQQCYHRDRDCCRGRAREAARGLDPSLLAARLLCRRRAGRMMSASAGRRGQTPALSSFMMEPTN